MPAPPQKVDVAVYGQPNSGKRTLVTALHGRIHRRASDNALFVLEVQTESDSTAQSAVGLVTIDSVEEYTTPHTTPRPLVQHVKSQVASCAIVITKIDLVPRDFSDDHLKSLALRPHLSCWNDVDCVQVSSKSGEGLDELLCWIVNTMPGPSGQCSPSPTNLWDRWLAGFLDGFAYCFALPTQRLSHKVDNEISEIEAKATLPQLLDNDIVSSWNKDIMRRLGADDPINMTGVYRVTPSLILKSPSSSECANTKYVLQHTTIPTPRLHCSLFSRIVMDYVQGEMLLECWSGLSWFLQFRIACTLRLYVRQMQRLKHTTVGSLESGLARGHLFEDRVFGPFHSVQQFRRLCECIAFESWRFVVIRARNKCTAIPVFPHPPADWTPVFIHGDLNWSNILLDKNRTVWLIDWGESGFYPSWMETLALRFYNDLVRGDTLPTSWTRYRQFIAGTSTREDEYFWDCVHGSIGRFSGQGSVW